MVPKNGNIFTGAKHSKFRSKKIIKPLCYSNMVPKNGNIFTGAKKKQILK